MSLRRYLAEQGLLGSTNIEAVEAAKLQYKRLYQRNKKREQRQSKKHITIVLEKDTAAQLDDLGKRHGYEHLATTARLIIEAFLQNAPLQPKAMGEAFSQAVSQLKKQGSNINQIVKHINTYQEVSQADLKAIFQLLEEQREFLKQILEHDT